MDKVVVLEEPPIPSIEEELIYSPVSDDSKATITKYTPNEVIVSVLMEHAGFLVLGDAYHPDWRVYVDGKPEKIFPANYLLRAVFLSQGPHVVKFVFQPPSFYWGAALSVLTLFFMGFVLIRNGKKG